jgi:hypothetical protein
VRAITLAAFAALLAGCTTGEGTGFVRSSRLFATNCWDGPFDLGPTFFASDPFEDTQQIRVQRGDNLVGVSDGVILVVNDVTRIRTSLRDSPIPLGVPIGVTPPGLPRRVGPDPLVSLSLYLNDSCHNQNPTVFSVGGTITFHKLFSGNRNENNADDRRTLADFDAFVADPRSATVGPVQQPPDGGQPSFDGGGVFGYADGGLAVQYKTSRVNGHFDFYFQRGLPAQPFP